MTFTVSDLYTDVYSELQDDRMRVRWPEAEVLRYINDGIRVIVTERPPAHMQKAAIVLVAGTLQSLPAGAIHLIDIPRNTGGAVIRRVNRDNLEADPDFHTQTESATIYEFAYDPGINPRDFWVSPPAVNGTSVDAWYSTYPAALTAGGDTVALGDEYRSPLRHYVLARCFNKEAEYASNEARVGIHMKQFYLELGLYEKARAVGSRPEHKGIAHRESE